MINIDNSNDNNDNDIQNVHSHLTLKELMTKGFKLAKKAVPKIGVDAHLSELIAIKLELEARDPYAREVLCWMPAYLAKKSIANAVVCVQQGINKVYRTINQRKDHEVARRARRSSEARAQALAESVDAVRVSRVLHGQAANPAIKAIMDQLKQAKNSPLPLVSDEEVERVRIQLERKRDALAAFNAVHPQGVVLIDAPDDPNAVNGKIPAPPEEIKTMADVLRASGISMED